MTKDNKKAVDAVLEVTNRSSLFISDGDCSGEQEPDNSLFISNADMSIEQQPEESRSSSLCLVDKEPESPTIKLDPADAEENELRVISSIPSIQNMQDQFDKIV